MEDLLFGLKLSVIGISVVFLALLLIALCIRLLAIFEDKPEKKSEKPVEAEEDDEITEELVAAITAAVTVSTGRRVRIKRIRYRDKPPEATWSHQGRVTVMASHITKH